MADGQHAPTHVIAQGPAFSGIHSAKLSNLSAAGSQDTLSSSASSLSLSPQATEDSSGSSRPGIASNTMTSRGQVQPHNSSMATSDMLSAAQQQQQLAEPPKAQHANATTGTTQAQQQQSSAGLQHLDLEADRAALAAELTNFTPEMIMRELLGSLFVHPSRLRFDTLLGQGTYATVHKANMLVQEGTGDEGLRMGVAVKRLKPEVLSSASDLKDYLLEVNVMRKLRHPNIVAIRGIGAADLSSLESVRSSMYVVMEMLEGGTLRDIVTRQMTSNSLVYDAKDALRWAQQIASAMYYLHEVCRPMIIHRDMKLENILLADNMKVAKLADFGLHKRARLNATTGVLVPAATSQPLLARLDAATPTVQPMTINYDDEKSYYGGHQYYAGQSTHQGKAAGALLQAAPSAAAAAASSGTAPGSQQGSKSSIEAGSFTQRTGHFATALPPLRQGQVLAADTMVASRTDSGPAGSTGAGSPRASRFASLPPTGVRASSSSSLHNPAQGRPSHGSLQNRSTHGAGSQHNNPSRHGLKALQHVAEGGSVGGGMRRNASLKELVDMAAVASKPAGGTMTRSASSMQDLQDAAAPPAIASPSFAAAQQGSSSMTASSVGDGALSSRLRRQRSQCDGDESVHGGTNALSALAAANATEGGEPMQLPAGVATLLSDPAQLHNLQSLHALLEHHNEDGSAHSRLTQSVHSAMADSKHGDNSRHAAAAPDAGTPGASTHGVGIYAARQKADTSEPAGSSQTAVDASVHRKMLALMALDVTPQGPYCMRPSGAFCSWPRAMDAALLPAGASPPSSQRGMHAPHAAAPAEPAAQQQQQQASAAAAAAATSTMGAGGVGTGDATATASGKNYMKAIPEDSRVSLDLTAIASMGTTKTQATAVGKSAALTKQGDASGKVPQAGPITSSGKASSTKITAMFAEATQQVGSLMYMAPELVNGHQYNHKVDVFSYGVMLWELFSGKLLAFKAELMTGGEEEVMAYVQRRAAGERERLPARWPQGLKDLVSACWQQDPSQRPTFKEVIAWLNALESTNALEGLIPSHLGITASNGGGCCTIM